MNAQEIIGTGETFEYVYKVWQKRHHGDAAVGKALLVSVGCQSVKNTKGIHVQLCGRSGIGKSDATLQMAGLMPNAYLKDDDITPQSLYYVGDGMRDSTIVLIDDIHWSDALGQSVKKITTHFQGGARKITTTRDLEAEERKTKKRLTFWVSSVDSQADEQIRDRFLLVNVDESSEHLAGVLRAMKAQDEGIGCERKLWDEEASTCKALIEDLKSHEFEVVIPFASKIRFKGDLRSYKIFSDMIKSFAVFSYKTREIDDKGRLMATVEDFESAKELWDELGGHDRDKYTQAERKVLTAIAAGNATQADIQKATGLSSGRVSDILNGRRDGHGLIQKCPQLIVEEGRPIRYSLGKGFTLEVTTIGLEERIDK